MSDTALDASQREGRTSDPTDARDLAGRAQPSDNLRDTFAKACARSDRPGSMVLRDRDLLPDTAPGYVYVVCTR